MINKIIASLNKSEIENWRISANKRSSLELFFVKKESVMRRATDTESFNVTVYRDFEKNGKEMRGFSQTLVPADASEAEITEKIKSAYYAASFVCNAYFGLPNQIKVPAFNVESSLFDHSQEENLKIMADALFANDTASDSFLNSAELFAYEDTVRLITSWGTDVEYTKRSIEGEFVTQCKLPQDVETYNHFRYTKLAPEELKTKVLETIATSRDRAIASEPPKAGNYDIILSGEAAGELLSIYAKKAAASSIFARYSDYDIGKTIHTPNEGADRLDMALIATDPYSSEGIPMENIPLITNGVLKNIHGGCRFCWYLGIPATGDYEAIRLPAGQTSLEDMKKKPYLHVVNFSDFDADAWSGHFGGEIRLAYYFDGEKVTPVTGGSVNGLLSECQNSFVFSKEMQYESLYEGPLAIRMSNISVAGK